MDFLKIAETVAAFETRLSAMMMLLTNVSSMVQQIHAHHVAAAAPGAVPASALDKALDTVGEVTQIAATVLGAASAAQAEFTEPATEPVNQTHG